MSGKQKIKLYTIITVPKKVRESAAHKHKIRKSSLLTSEFFSRRREKNINKTHFHGTIRKKKREIYAIPLTVTTRLLGA